MSPRAFLRAELLGVIAMLTLAASPAAAQGPTCSGGWIPTFGSTPGTNGEVLALCSFDSGSGPEIYIGGTFSVAGSTAASNIARFDGSGWHTVGSGTNGGVRTLFVHDDGSGPALYVGGTFSTAGGISTGGLARWNGSSWSSVGGVLNGNVHALATYDEGSGPKLFVGGLFNGAGASGAQNLARWNGTSWSALTQQPSGTVRALKVFDDGLGGGPALYVGGGFSAFPGVTNIGRWNGTSWSALAQAPNNWIYALAVHDDGGGPALFAGGQFTAVGGQFPNYVAKWNGTAWSGLASGANGPVYTLASYDDGSGSGARLLVGGSFGFASGTQVNRVAAWAGGSWAALAGGVTGGVNGVSALLPFVDSAGVSYLYAGGDFTNASGLAASRIVRWNGTAWSLLGNGLDASVRALTVFDDGTSTGPRLVAGGTFVLPGGAPSRRIAAWNGSSWAALGAGVDGPVNALAVFDPGTGPALYLGGQFFLGQSFTPGVARWTGSTYVPLLPGPGGVVQALAAFDDGSGPALFAAGNFSVSGPLSRWNGSTWTPVATGFPFSDGWALCVFDDQQGGGPALYLAGRFPGGIARWDGTSMTVVGGGIGGVTSPTGRSLAVHDDGLGGGPCLYLGGSFTTAGTAQAKGIARWNGVAWSALGAGLDLVQSPTFPAAVRSLRSYDDPTNGTRWLVAGGNIASSGGVPLDHLARWNGTAWSAMGSGANGDVLALAVYDSGNGAGPRLFAGGEFSLLADSQDSFLAAWGCAGPGSVTVDCAGDGSGAACPCGNLGATGRGCANSVDPAGGRLSAAGPASLSNDVVVLQGSGMPNAAALYFQGTTGLGGIAFGDGLRCAGGTVIRLKTVVNAGGASQVPGVGDARVSVTGQVLTVGQRKYQVWYRNAAAFCTSATFNLTNGISIHWGP